MGLGLGFGHGYGRGEFVAASGGGQDLEVPIDATNTLAAYDPSTIVAAGGLLSTWNDRTANARNLDRVSRDHTAPTQPTVVDPDDDFGVAVELNSDEDVRASADTDLTAIAGVDDDSYWWMVFKTTITDATDAAGLKFVAGAHGGGAPDSGYVRLAIQNAAPRASHQGADSGAALVATTTVINDGVPHLYELKWNASVNSLQLFIDGVSAASKALDATHKTDLRATSYLFVGTSATGGNSATPLQLAMFMVDQGIPNATRLTAVREWARDNMGCTGIA